MNGHARWAVCAVVALTVGASGAQTPAPLPVYAAGSLREVMTQVAGAWEARGGQKVALTFGASGLLRERIEKGEPAQVFASADTDHPQRLATAGGWLAPAVFTRNTLCALTGAHVNATPSTLLATLLRPDVRVGTSTPRPTRRATTLGRCSARPTPYSPAPTRRSTPRRSS